MAGEIFGIAYGVDRGLSLYYIAEGPAGQPLNVVDSVWGPTPVGPTLRPKHDFTGQAAVDAYVAARGAALSGGRWTFMALQLRPHFTVQPSNTVSGQVISPAVQVTLKDSLGNVATHELGLLAVRAIGPEGQVLLSGTKAVQAVNGVATFSDLSINVVDSGYFLNVRSPLFSGLPVGAMEPWVHPNPWVSDEFSAAFNITAS